MNQKDLFSKFAPFREPPKWPTYPPYATEYLEEFFLNKFEKEMPETKRKFIPVAWSSCYINHNDRPLQALQDALKSLPQDEAYFAVATHDDAVREALPKNTMVFSAGGNKGDVPIPLVCSSIPENKIPKKEKDIFCSFVGSLTHPIRNEMVSSLKDNPKFFLKAGNWSNSVSKEKEEDFLSVMARSKFSLCPRGYGPTSYRLYEAMQVGSVPVYVYDREWLPWQDEIDWSECIITIHQSQVGIIDLMLEAIDEEEIQKKIENCKKIYKSCLTFDKTFDRILSSLKDEEKLKEVLKL